MGSLRNRDELVGGDSDEAILYVNGVRRVLPDGLAHLTLLEYLRDSGLTGTKLGCGEGGCGACTVMVSYFDRNLNKCVHCAINACLAPLYSLEGMHVITVEGIGNHKKGLHPIQESLARAHGSQCGFCTPGFVMSMYALLRSKQSLPSHEEVEECLAGNLCRCTGYRPILDAFGIFSKSTSYLHIDGSNPGGEKVKSICPATGMPCQCLSKQACKDSTLQSTDFADRLELLPHNLTRGSSYIEKELIFPPELLFRKVNYLNMHGSGGIKWYRPLKLRHLLTLKENFPDAKFVAGNTELCIEIRMKRIHHQILISVLHVPELNMLNVKDDGLEIGAAVRLSELLRVLREVVQQRAAHEVSSCKALIKQIKWFAGTQIKNVASVGGNICTASPISDLNPLWIAARARFTVVSTTGNLREALAENFFMGYRKVDLASDEILLSIFLPWSRTFEYVREFKQSHRRDDDIAIVNAGMRVHLQKEDAFWVVLSASIVYGGVAPLPLSVTNTQHFLIGKKWNQELLDGALKILEQDIVLKEDAPGGMVEFRKALMLSFLFKFFLWVSYVMDEKSENIPASHLSAIQTFHKPSTVGSQDYEIVKRGIAVGSPAIHLSSRLQVTGEAEYTDDSPMPPNGLHAALLLSSKPHARIISIDDSKAKTTPGFVGIYFSKDVPGINQIDPVVADEELFASKFVTCVGQVIGVVVADTHANAKEAVGKVVIQYQELPAVLSIGEAIESESFHPNSARILSKGDAHLCFLSGQCDRILEGEVQIGGQEHFYLEPHSSLVWTVDGGNEVHMISSTQAPQKHQKYVANVLGLPMSKVVCRTKRIGGGFGGKETRSAIFAAAASVASYLLDRPVKITLDRDIDMMISGQRHSFLGKYKVGYTLEGKIMALDLDIYNNGGNSLDLSNAVLERAMFHSDNVYEIPNICIRGRVCYTNFPSNTAFRGFGAPQGMLITENWIQRIAMDLKRSPEEIRENNFQSEGSVLHYGQQLQSCTLGRLWNELKSCCGFSKAREDVKEFNIRNRWKKRGIAMVPTKFGISFTLKLMNQAGALVQVYTDGTVLVTHGGVEMGQGLHTKIAQVAASAFDIPLNSVFISETSTDKVPNASPTAASASSDMYGAAVLDACEQIKARMSTIASKYRLCSFAEIASTCYRERVDLSAHGFFITPDIGFDWNNGKGNPFRYFTYGVASAEVEIDTLTGDFHTRAANVHLDLGFSLNPAIDVGQIEGAFIQGMGWLALEELKWGDDAHKWISPGCLYTCGPGTYKIPSVNDVPFKFNISLLKGSPNTKAIHSSKAVGEPPFFLASSVFFAIKDAIIAARAEEGHHEWFPLDNPATPERIRMACMDRFTSPFTGAADFRSKLSV